jgi:hypothetical protein
MNMEVIKIVKQYIPKLISQLAVAFFCCYFIQDYYQVKIQPYKMIVDQFKPVSCTVINKNLDVRGKAVHRYRALFLVSYAADGSVRQNVVSGRGLDFGLDKNRRYHESVLNQFAVGQQYTCYVDPEDVNSVALNVKYNWLTTLPLLFPVAVTVVMLVYLLMGLRQCIHELRLWVKFRRRNAA